MKRDATEAGGRLGRRQLGLALAGSAAAATLPVALPGEAAAAPGGPVVRLAAIPAVQLGGLLGELLAVFEAETGYRVAVSESSHAAAFARARSGEADLTITHFGVPELREFVGEGLGRWPQLVLSNSFVFLGPPADPAGIRATGDPVTGLAQIAQTRTPFVVNNLAEPAFMTDTLWHAAGAPDRDGWYVDEGLSGPAAMQAAAARGGYTIWGLHPFLMLREQQPIDLAPVLFPDSLLQRGIASVVVNPGRTRRVNLRGALALERFLSSTETQGRIRAFRHPAFDEPVFWPAAHHNDNQRG
jgi:tungstate transport system substrate-binding protein